ncbi:uncharacterized protein LOC111031981 [Myzus persicae]|uniref:uncharacterized protein LOC111031981 n=1 Tax=Myzus persicae TaxID=13164 RepID=UPI000B932330|nr:uncharacterized protein LOC111031981 [Myzus persicae]
MCSNTECSVENRTRNSATIILNNINKIHTKGFSYLQNLLQRYLLSKTMPCLQKNCYGIISRSINLGNHIFIEADTLSLNSTTYSCLLSDIPVKMDLNQKKYALVAVIHYVSFHYMTYVRRAYGKWERHNDLEQKIKKIKSIEKTKVNPHLLLYIETND